MQGESKSRFASPRLVLSQVASHARPALTEYLSGGKEENNFRTKPLYARARELVSSRDLEFFSFPFRSSRHTLLSGRHPLAIYSSPALFSPPPPHDTWAIEKVIVANRVDAVSRGFGAYSDGTEPSRVRRLLPSLPIYQKRTHASPSCNCCSEDRG